jgi:hypothetical protein
MLDFRVGPVSNDAGIVAMVMVPSARTPVPVRTFTYVRAGDHGEVEGPTSRYQIWPVSVACNPRIGELLMSVLTTTQWHC